MKKTRIASAILLLAVLAGLLAGCSSGGDEEAAPDRVAAVTRGNLTLDISAAGNLALSLTEDLAVDLFYPAGTKGTIGEVLVEAGDQVSSGQLLLTMDKVEWDSQLDTLANQVTTQERNLTQAESNLLSAQQALANLKDTTAKEKAVKSAEVSLMQAQNTLNAGFTAIDTQITLAALNKAKAWLDYVNTTLRQSVSAEEWGLENEIAKQKLDIAQINYDNNISGFNNQDIILKKTQVEIAEMTLKSARKDLADVPHAIAMQEIQVKLMEGRLEDAQKALADARKKVSDAKAKSPEIKAPFDGFVTKVNVKGGDEVLNGTIAIQLADPDKFEANILVSEMDIAQVKIGGTATVSIDSLSGVSLPASVAHISPTATIQSGVVNYSVKVEVQARDAMPAAGANITTAAGELSPVLQAAVDSGRMTREQALEMQKNIQSGSFSLPANIRPPSGSGQVPQGGFTFPGQSPAAPRTPRSQVPASAVSNVQLREGLTVTVSIVVSSVNDAVLVPNAAVTREGQKYYVRIPTAAGGQEKREVKTGISDWQNTVITEGLTDGEKVLVPQALANTNASTTRTPGGGMFFGAPRR